MLVAILKILSVVIITFLSFSLGLWSVLNRVDGKKGEGRKEINMANSGATAAQKKWIQILHVAKRECGLDDAAYRALLAGACGVESAGAVTTWKQYNAALEAFKNLGFRVTSKAGRAGGLEGTDRETERNPKWITARQEYYIRGLWELASRKKDEASLRAMIKRIGGVDDLRFLKRVTAQKVIPALRDIAKKRDTTPTGKVWRND